MNLHRTKVIAKYIIALTYLLIGGFLCLYFVAENNFFLRMSCLTFGLCALLIAVIILPTTKKI